MPQEITTAQIDQLVAVVGWALGLAFAGMLLIAVGADPWRWLWREARGAWHYFVQASWRGYGRFADGVPESGNDLTERHSDAVEQAGNGAGTGIGNAVPGSLFGRINALPEGELLGMLALLTDADGNWRYAESRLAKFAGGRVIDRMAEIRAVRGEPEPEPAEPEGRAIPMRDATGERMVRV